MRWILASVLASLGVVGACAPPSIGEYPDSEDNASKDPPSRRQSPSTAGTNVPAIDGGARPKGNPLFLVNIVGTGSVTSSPAGVTCTGAQCTGSFATGTKVTLTPVPGEGFLFAGWSGQCIGADACAPTIAGDVTIGAEFQTLAGTWTGTFTHSQQNQGCTFNNAGDMTMTATATNATTLATTTVVTGLEIKNIPGCGLIDKRQGTASSNVNVTNGTLTGTWKFSIPNIGGTLDLPFSAKLNGKTLNGTWTCNGCTGSFTLKK